MNRAFSDLFGSGPGALAESLVLAVVFAWLGYRMSVRHRAVRGVTPWRLPSAIWALICLVLQFIGIAIEILAELTTRPPLPSPRTPGAAGAGISAASDVPDYSLPYPRPAAPAGPATPADAGATEAVPAARDAVRIGPPPPPSDQEGRPPLFGWYPDPSGRHELRYFDGRHWADLVVDGGEHSNDPV